MLGRRGFGEVGATIAKAGLASLAMGIVVWIVWRLAEQAFGESGIGQLLNVMLPVLAGVLAYLATARLLRIAELDHFLGIVRRRLRPIAS